MENNEAKMETSSAQYNDATMKNQLVHEEVNSAYNHSVIVDAFEKGRARDISDEPKAEGKPCIIIGSGASLDLALPLLKDWKGGVICTTSHALSLIKFGIEPTHILALDPFCTYEEIEGVDWSKTKTKLIAHPGVWPTLIHKWPNEILMYIENIGRPDSYYATTQKRMYTWREGEMRRPTFHYYIRTELTLFACSPPAQLFVADRLGFGSIFLCGIDFACTYGKDRFTNWTIKDDIWESHDNPIVEEKDAEGKVTSKMIYSNNGIPSAPIHLYYKKNFISAWRLSHQTVYTTDIGALTEIPFIDLKEVIEKQGEGFPKQSVEFIDDVTEKYLASVFCFVVRTAIGNSFVEAREPDNDLYKYMMSIKQQYICDTCGAKATANDFIEYMGTECSACKKGKLKHFADIDVEANMARFSDMIGRKLIPKAEEKPVKQGYNIRDGKFDFKKQRKHKKYGRK